METKVCTKCGCNKKLESFRKNGKYYRGECKECEKKYQKNYNEKHGKEVYERRKDKAKIYRELHKQKNKDIKKNIILIIKKNIIVIVKNIMKLILDQKNQLKGID